MSNEQNPSLSPLLFFHTHRLLTRFIISSQNDKIQSELKHSDGLPPHPMHSVGIYEAKSRFSALVELVEQGEEVRITRHGKEVVRMLPVRRKPVITDEQIARELEQIQALQQTVRAQAATDSVASLRQNGRSKA